MRILDRYVLLMLLSSWISISLTLILLAWLVRFLNTMNLVTSAGQSLTTVLKITALVIPEIAFVVFPITLFIATILTIRRLNADSEYAVMVSSGFSPAMLARPFLMAFGIGALIMAVLSFVVQPYTLAKWREAVTHAGADLLTTILEPGKFSQLGGKFVFHFRERSEEGALLGIIVEDNSAKDDKVIYLAEKGTLYKDSENAVLVLENGSVQRPTKENEDNYLNIQFGRYTLDFSQFTSADQQVRYKIREYSNTEIWDALNDDTINAEQKTRLKAELHMRISAPILIICFGCVALAFMLKVKSNRQDNMSMIFMAILIVLILRVMSLNFISGANKDEAMIFNIYLVAIGPIILAALEILGIFSTTRYFEMLISPFSSILSGIIKQISAVFSRGQYSETAPR